MVDPIVKNDIDLAIDTKVREVREDGGNIIESRENNFTYTEVPVRYKKRIGAPKVSGTIKGSIFAGIKILGWIFKYSLK